MDNVLHHHKLFQTLAGVLQVYTDNPSQFAIQQFLSVQTKSPHHQNPSVESEAKNLMIGLTSC